MKLDIVLAVIRVGEREISADFRTSSGRLIVAEAAEIIEELRPPDSWVALASLKRNDSWGTRPTTAELLTFLERYVAEHPRFSATNR
ncbi:hypothetical protein AWB74_07533 [Caballeronia arvi]|uniref:Uncharacterized protein n=1 Tax=Caballeronia arvi TaxID=1777135 RepID=A0A158KZ43_9BURK|nr:hypothetical protein [Caballeronia arvi]SAL86019.1 hypothetical protein AWB74_07533 [Caballeronia arvi]